MSSRDFETHLAARLEREGIVLTNDVAVSLQAYYRLLERWNARINLTSLPLSDPTDETLDRLFVEAMAAARYVADSPLVWFDLGSGGGSPAIPLKVMRPRARLVMVESKTRKTAFLREAVRVLGLVDVHVETARFEEIASEAPQTAQVVTVRAVRVDDGLFDVARQLLVGGGRLLLFSSGTASSLRIPEDFRPLDDISSTLATALMVLVHVPRGTHNDRDALG